MDERFGVDRGMAAEQPAPKGRFDELLASLDEPDTRLLLQEAARRLVTGKNAEQAHRILSRIQAQFQAIARLQKP